MVILGIEYRNIEGGDGKLCGHIFGFELVCSFLPLAPAGVDSFTGLSVAGVLAASGFESEGTCAFSIYPATPSSTSIPHNPSPTLITSAPFSNRQLCHNNIERRRGLNTRYVR